MKENEFTKEELILIKKLKSFSEGIIPSRDSFEQMLASLPGDPVTNYDSPRYMFSMWKFAVASFAIVLLIGFALLKHGQINPANQLSQVAQNQAVPQTVTADNEDAALQQTDSAISQTTDQMDQELNSLDQNSSNEDDINSL